VLQNANTPRFAPWSWGPRAAAWNGVHAPPACPALHERPTHDLAVSPLRRFGSPPPAALARVDVYLFRTERTIRIDTAIPY